MNKLTAEEIIKLLEEGFAIDEEDEDYDEYDLYTPGEFIDTVQSDSPIEDPKLREALGEIKYVAHVIDPDDYYTHQHIIHFVDHDVYLRIDGYYNSYEGYVSYEDSEWGVEVFPKTITQTIYEKVGE